MLLGAELTASLEFWGDGRWKRATTIDVRFREVVSVARRLVEEERGQGLSFERLRMDTGIPKRELEDALERLTEEGVVRRDGELYVLARASGEITLGALYETSAK